MSRDITQTKNGNFVVTGNIGDILWLLRISRKGQVIWQRKYPQLGMPATDSDSTYYSVDGVAVIQTSDMGFTIGGNTTGAGGAPFLLHVTDQGKKIWYKQYNEEINYHSPLYALGQEPMGGYIFSILPTSLPFVPSPIVRTTKNGKFIGFGFERHGTNIAGNSIYYDILRLHDDSGYIMSGRGPAGLNVITKVSNNGKQVIWSHTYERGTVRDLQLTQNGDIVAAATLNNNEGICAYFFKLDSNGNVIWKRIPDISGENHLYGIQETKDGGFIFAGEYHSTYRTLDPQPLIIRTDSSGHIQYIGKDLRPFSK